MNKSEKLFKPLVTESSCASVEVDLLTLNHICQLGQPSSSARVLLQQWKARLDPGPHKRAGSREGGLAFARSGPIALPPAQPVAAGEDLLPYRDCQSPEPISWSR